MCGEWRTKGEWKAVRDLIDCMKKKKERKEKGEDGTKGGGEHRWGKKQNRQKSSTEQRTPISRGVGDAEARTETSKQASKERKKKHGQRKKVKQNVGRRKTRELRREKENDERKKFNEVNR